MHTLENPLITLHDARGQVVFAQPLLHHDPAQVLFTKAWDWVKDEAEKEKIREAYQQVLFDLCGLLRGNGVIHPCWGGSLLQNILETLSSILGLNCLVSLGYLDGYTWNIHYRMLLMEFLVVSCFVFSTLEIVLY